MSLNFITGNDKKFREASGIIPGIQMMDMDLPEIQSLNPEEVIEEKLNEAIRQKPGEQFVVEDTSLFMAAINGLPGPLIKWHLQAIGNRGLWEIAEKFNNFAATAKTVVGLIDGNGKKHFFHGEIHGTIVAPRTAKAFGWDPIFVPQGLSKSFAEMTPSEKSAVSMRGIAFRKLKAHLGL